MTVACTSDVRLDGSASKCRHLLGSAERRLSKTSMIRTAASACMPMITVVMPSEGVLTIRGAVVFSTSPSVPTRTRFAHTQSDAEVASLEPLHR